jgi:DnaJ-class molecular chaperone
MKNTEQSYWQLCPKCGGDGNLLRYNSPPIMSSSVICDVCNGKKIINIYTGLPPKLDQTFQFEEK